MYIFNPQPGNMVEARLYLGRDVNGSYGVHETDFSDFLNESVMPRFDGFTVLHGLGYWKGADETVSVLSILMEDTLTNRHSVRVIAEHYNDRFKQEAVMVQFLPCAFDLVTWPHAGTGYRAGAGGTSGWVDPADRGLSDKPQTEPELVATRFEEVMPDPEAPIDLIQARDAIATFSRDGLVTVQGHDDLHNH